MYVAELAAVMLADPVTVAAGLDKQGGWTDGVRAGSTVERRWVGHLHLAGAAAVVSVAARRSF